jgi:hypothetical protein
MLCKYLNALRQSFKVWISRQAFARNPKAESVNFLKLPRSSVHNLEQVSAMTFMEESVNFLHQITSSKIRKEHLKSGINGVIFSHR